MFTASASSGRRSGVANSPLIGVFYATSVPERGLSTPTLIAKCEHSALDSSAEVALVDWRVVGCTGRSFRCRSGIVSVLDRRFYTHWARAYSHESRSLTASQGSGLPWLAFHFLGKSSNLPRKIFSRAGRPPRNAPLGQEDHSQSGHSGAFDDQQDAT